MIIHNQSMLLSKSTNYNIHFHQLQQTLTTNRIIIVKQIIVYLKSIPTLEIQRASFLPIMIWLPIILCHNNKMGTKSYFKNKLYYLQCIRFTESVQTDNDS